MESTTKINKKEIKRPRYLWLYEREIIGDAKTPGARTVESHFVIEDGSCILTIHSVGSVGSDTAKDL